nr:IS110 family transposase [Rhizobium sullae]
MLVNEILSRDLRDRRAVARYAGLTGSPDESGKRRREKGLARAGSARVRRGMIQLAWRFLRFQKQSGLAQWFQARTTDGRGTAVGGFQTYIAFQQCQPDKFRQGLRSGDRISASVVRRAVMLGPRQGAQRPASERSLLLKEAIRSARA